MRLPNDVTSLINKKRLRVDKITEICVFQLENGTIRNKEHYQGAFTLIGIRVSKKQLLELFKNKFNNVNSLTLSKIYDKKAAVKYASKSEGRIRGPFYVDQKKI